MTHVPSRWSTAASRQACDPAVPGTVDGERGSPDVPDVPDASAPVRVDAPALDWRRLIADRLGAADRVGAVRASNLVEADLAAYDRLTGLLASQLGTRWSFLTVVDDVTCHWKCSVGIDAGRRRSTLASESFCKYVIAVDGSFAVVDARSDERTAGNESVAALGVVGWAGSPVRDAAGQILGALCVAHDEPRDWSVTELELIESLADVASTTLQLRAALGAADTAAAALRAEVALRELIADRAALLADLGNRLAGARSTDEVVAIMTTFGPRVLGAEFANIATLDEGGHHLRLVHAPSLPTEVADRYVTVPLADATPLADAVRTNELVLIANLDELRGRYPDLVDDTIAAGLRATASLPLTRADGTPAGALGVGWAEPQEFSPLMRALLTTVLLMCAQALDRALLGDAQNSFLRAIQSALLPAVPVRPGLEIAARYLPANVDLGFGGDWYDVIPLSPTRTVLVVGDVCGHGIAAAATMAQVRGAINAVVRLHPDPLETVERVEEVLDLSRRDFIATFSLHVVDIKAGTLTYVSAGHPPALAVRGREHTFLDRARRPPLGLLAPPAPRTGVAAFGRGDLLVAYTDGLIEQRRTDLGAGMRDLVEALDPIRDEPVSVIADRLATTSGAAGDDIALLVVRRVDRT